MSTKTTGRKARCLVIAVVFCVVCLIYLIRMFQIQVLDRSGYVGEYNAPTTTKLLTIQSVRGEIYDRNGVKLVENRYTYHFILDYYALPSGVAEENDALLLALRLMEKNGIPYEGTFVYGGDAERPVLLSGAGSQRKLAEALGLDAGAELKEITDALEKKYLLGGEAYSGEERTTLLGIRSDLLLDGFGRKTLQYTMAKNVDERFIAGVREENRKGLTFSMEVSRGYLYPGYASHILGAVGKIYSENWSYYEKLGYSMNSLVGTFGCESAFEDLLRGIDGEEKLLLDENGAVVDRIMTKPPVAGKDVYLTIDIQLQIAAEDGLRENAEYIRTLGSDYENCKSGALVAEDPKTGGVLAIASYPTYDLSAYNIAYGDLLEADGNPLLNRATCQIYAPGSTFKLGVSAAALTEHVLEPDTCLQCSGKYLYYPDYQPKCWYTYGHGTTSITKAIRVSCNCFFYEAGRLLGIDRIVRYGEAFGLGQPTGIEIREERGILASREEYPYYHKGETWTDGLTLQAAIGQSDNSFTPLQISNYVGTVLSGGTRYSAHLLYEVRTFGGELLTGESVKAVSSIPLDRDAVSTVMEGMRQVVYGNKNAVPGNEYANGNQVVYQHMKNLPVTVGAKTGTAQTYADDNALFVCAAPYDQPEIVICCVLEKGCSGQYASLAAARVLEVFYRVE